MLAQISRPFRFLLPALVAILTPLSTFALEDVNPEVTEEVRLISAREKLSANPSIVVLYAEGLCCPSCAIGVRKKVSKLSNVDRAQFNNGVDLDTKTQLVSVAMKSEPTKIDLPSLAQAIWDAGYTPVRTYHLDAGDLRTTALPAENSD